MGDLTEGERRALLAVFVAILYCISLWVLGVTWWKAPVVGLMAGATFVAQFSMRVISRGAVALLILASAVWIEALPPPSQWKPIASSATSSALASK
jgi:hypothetical protein